MVWREGVMAWSRQETPLGWTPWMAMECSGTGRDPQPREDAEMGRWSMEKEGCLPAKNKGRDECPHPES